jgi:hypothetical protein
MPYRAFERQVPFQLMRTDDKRYAFADGRRTWT